MHSSKACFSQEITLKCSYGGEKELINIHELTLYTLTLNKFISKLQLNNHR